MPELYTIVTESRSRSPKITDLDENHNLKPGKIDNNFKINSTSNQRQIKDKIFKIDSKELIKIGPFFEGLMRHTVWKKEKKAGKNSKKFFLGF